MYHLRIHCKKGPGVLVQLTSALEALDFDIVNANLTSVNDHVLNTVVVKVGLALPLLQLPSLKYVASRSLICPSCAGCKW